jgi:hypothetical protein
MRIQPEASVVRIFTADDRIVGTGFLVSKTTILSCAHVVAAALGIAAETPRRPERPISLDFPLVAAQPRLTAHVVCWQPIQANSGGDIAVLRLDSLAPDGAMAARLVRAEDLVEHDFEAFGFPDRHDEGVWAAGKLRRRQATGWIQIEDVKVTGHRVALGFSGAAVWDEQLGGVAGMVVAEDSNAPIKVAFMIPTTVLISACPELDQQAIPPCPYRGLLAFREKDEPYFFGRKKFTEELLEAVRRKSLVAVVGPSGSGKSSVVFAGLLPRLRQEARWTITLFRPGNRPFHSLAEALLDLLEPTMSEIDRLAEISKLAQRLQQGELALQDVVERILRRYGGPRLLLVADQFEELYTLCREQEVRQHFLDELLDLV